MEVDIRDSREWKFEQDEGKNGLYIHGTEWTKKQNRDLVDVRPSF